MQPQIMVPVGAVEHPLLAQQAHQLLAAMEAMALHRPFLDHPLLILAAEVAVGLTRQELLVPEEQEVAGMAARLEMGQEQRELLI